MVWTVIPNTDIDADSPLTVALLTALRDNVAAAFAKDFGAPQLADNYITQAMINALAVGQGELKTATSEVSTTIDAYLTFASGDYGFYPRTRSATGIHNGLWQAEMSGDTATHTISASYITRIRMNPSASGTAMYARTRYIQASPPYNLGDGDVPLFVFMMVNKSTGKAESIYAAPEAPWHYNGPTSIIATRKEKASGRSWKNVPQIIKDLSDANLTKQEAIRLGVYSRAEIQQRISSDSTVEMEITQNIKQSDMAIIPHPFQGNDLRNYEVVMLDPVSANTERLLNLQNDGEDINQLIYDGRISFDNKALNRSTPSGVMAVNFTL